MSARYEHARPAVAVDCVVFGLGGAGLEVLLVERGQAPFEGRWALPGGFVRVGEDLESAARRELQEETGLEDVFLEQLYTYGAPDRDPREHVVSVAWVALTNVRHHRVEATTDARSAAWFSVDDLPELAFDHATILEAGRERLRGKVRYRPIGFELLPRRFTLTDLQQLYETLTGSELDKRNFRKKVLSFGILVDTGAQETGIGRPARLYRFDKRRYQTLEREGFEMWL